MTDREVMKMALEALEELNEISKPPNGICLPAEIDTAMDALRQALAQPEQEPVAFIEQLTGKPKLIGGYVVRTDADIPLYMTPPKREWVGLTDDEIEHLRNDQPWWMVRDIEAKLKEKNNGST